MCSSIDQPAYQAQNHVGAQFATRTLKTSPAILVRDLVGMSGRDRDVSPDTHHSFSPADQSISARLKAEYGMHFCLP